MALVLGLHVDERDLLHVAGELGVFGEAFGELSLDLLDLLGRRGLTVLENRADVVLYLLHDVLVGEHGHVGFFALDVCVVEHASFLAVAVSEVLVPPQPLELEIKVQ